jgi:ribonuclease P protein component
MLPYNNRLIAKKDFEVVNRQGNFFSFGDLVIKVKENGLSQTRIGIAVGLKFSKKAVVRNRAKRQIREIAREELKSIKNGLDIVVMIRKGEKEKLDTRELSDMFKKILEKGNLISLSKK